MTPEHPWYTLTDLRHQDDCRCSDGCGHGRTLRHYDTLNLSANHTGRLSKNVPTAHAWTALCRNQLCAVVQQISTRWDSQDRYLLTIYRTEGNYIIETIEEGHASSEHGDQVSDEAEDSAGTSVSPTHVTETLPTTPKSETPRPKPSAFARRLIGATPIARGLLDTLRKSADAC